MTARSGTSVRHPTWAEAVFSAGRNRDANHHTRDRSDRRDAAVRTPRRAGHRRRLLVRVRRPRRSAPRQRCRCRPPARFESSGHTREPPPGPRRPHREEDGATSTGCHPQSSPVHNRDLFQLLRAAGWINEDLARRLQHMVGFRNILVHEYARTNLAIVRDVLENRVEDLADFSQAVARRLSSEPRPGNVE